MTYDTLQSLARRVGLRMSDLFAEPGEEPVQAVTARPSLGDIARSVRVGTPNYDYHYLCTELRRKRMIPVEPGQALYIDSSLGQAYLAATECGKVEVLAVMSSEEVQSMESLLTLHQEQRGSVAAENENTAPGTPKLRRRGR